MVGLRVGQTGTKTFRDPPGLTRVREMDKWLRLVTKTATCLPISNHKVDVTTANMDHHKYIRDTVQLVCSLQGLQHPGSARSSACFFNGVHVSWTQVCAIARSPGRCSTMKRRLKTNERAPRVSSPRTAQQSHARNHEPSGSEPPVTVRRNLGGVARQHLRGLEERACLDVLRHCPSFKIPLRVRVGRNRMNRPTTSTITRGRHSIVLRRPVG